MDADELAEKIERVEQWEKYRELPTELLVGDMYHWKRQGPRYDIGKNSTVT